MNETQTQDQTTNTPERDAMSPDTTREISAIERLFKYPNYTPQTLKHDIIQYVQNTDVYPITPLHVQNYLGISQRQLKILLCSEEIKEIWDQIKMFCLQQQIDYGFLTDKSFTKFYLQEFKEDYKDQNPKDTQIQGGKIVIEFDTRTREDLNRELLDS